MAQKVLLVDDDQYIRELYEEILKNAGFEVETAVDGKEGFEKIIAGGYDLVLLDVMLPYLDGIGILDKLREEKPKVGNGPIILLTNLAYDPVIKDAIQKGAVACLNKAEMNPDEFLKKIKEVLK
ncbi:MAG: response regulator [Candidatus Shapirobacteria bacterium]|jgi:DNA-binding response OmpR family regulator